MARLLPNSLLKRKRLSSVLGLTLDGSRLEGVLLRRTNGSVHVVRTLSATLSLNPLTAGPELVGREIRNCLDSADIREKVCVVGLPIGWFLTANIDLPELSEEDSNNLLALEAERVFPCDPGSLQVVTVQSPASGGKACALLVGAPKANVELLANALRAAKLQPIRFSLALTAMQPASEPRSSGVIALSIGENSAGLQVTGRDGILSLRALEGVIEQEGGRKTVNHGAVGREIRITLGQLPPSQRELIRHIRIFGSDELARPLADELELKWQPLGLDTEIATRQGGTEHGLRVSSETPLSGAFSLAAQQLAGKQTPFEFLPPYVGPWQRISRRYASGRFRMAIAGAGAVVLLIAALFGYQQWKLWRLQSQWAGISGRVKELENVQERIRQFRPWDDRGYTSLTILRQLTTAFPAEGIVNAKSVEIRNGELVTCSGTARDNRSLLGTLDKLRSAGGVEDVQVNQLRGRSPTQFTFDFRWREGEAE